MMKKNGISSSTTTIRRMRRTAERLVLVACMLGGFAPIAVAADPSSEDFTVPDRRREQFPKDFGYAAFPYPYRLPGIGSGLSFAAGAFNIADTCTDAYGIVFTGDVKGGAAGVSDIHLIPRTLILDLGYCAIKRVTLQRYRQRGMNTANHDFRLVALGDTEYYGARMTATFFERRFELHGYWYEGASRLKSIRDKDGNLIVEAQDPPRNRGHTMQLGTRFDLTDDYTDPRRGLRLDITRTQSPPRGSGPDSYVMDYNTTAYIPFGQRNTLALNLLRSDAFVTRQGETNRAALQQQLGLPCGSLTGAHTLFFGAEYRWNLTDERTPFDIFVMKSVRTSIQLALFYETGVTSDERSDLYKRSNMRDSYGAGFRIVTASGVVLRADLAYGKEGVNTAIFIGYPWEL